MNNILELEEKQVVIFGIGTNARILKYIYQEKGIEIIAYLIGDDQDIHIDACEGKPVYKLAVCNEEIKKYPVVSTVRECASLKVQKELEECGFHRIVVAGDYRKWVEVLEYFYQAYFENKEIDIHKAILNINGCHFINGFQLDVEGKYAFLAELGDIVLPGCFGDYSICNEGPYELEEIGFRIEKGEEVFDCGANMGLFSSLAISRGARVWGFEPTPHTREYLHQLEKAYPTFLTIYPYALSDKEGETHFYVGSNMNGENSINNLSGTCKECITVPLKTIDSFVNEHNISKVDFIKADIEGAERYMLWGAMETMRKFAPKLAICTYHLRDDPGILEKIIKQANTDYKVVHKYKKLYAYVEK